MLMYILMLIVSVAAGIPLCSKKCGKWGRIVYCVVMGSLFIFISASRFEVGYDFNSYSKIYYDLKYSELSDVMANRLEKGFLMPLYALSMGFEEYYHVIIYTSVIINAAVFVMIYKGSSVPWISVVGFLCFGLYFNSLNFLRQFMAALIVMYALKFMSTKTFWRYAVLVLTASLFHWSALLMLPLYFFIKIKPGKRYLSIAAACTVLFCIFSTKMMLWAVEHIDMYSTYNPETNIEAKMGLPVRYTVMFGVLFAVAFAFRKQLIEKNPNNAYYINCLMFTAIFEAFGTQHGILSRFAILVYLTPVIYLVPDMVTVTSEYFKEKFSGKKGKLAQIAALSAEGVFAFACYIILMVNNYNGVMPYQNYFTRPFDIFVETEVESSDEMTEAEWESYGIDDGLSDEDEAYYDSDAYEDDGSWDDYEDDGEWDEYEDDYSDEGESLDELIIGQLE